MPVIALTTDFGTQDHYVACMKGAILQINPKATIVDVTHDIPPHGIIQAAFVLRQVWPWFPAGTVHVVVVDPGVGTGRRILVGRYSDRCIVAPDNGVMSIIHRDAQLQELRVVENRRFFATSLSTTFHGRDIMAPVGAHISNGVRLSDLGAPTDHLEVLDLPRPRIGADGSLSGEVLYVDRFGNLITCISIADLNALAGRRGRLSVRLGEREIGPIRSTYGEAEPGQPVALVGSTQMLEIAVNRGSAAQMFEAGVATPVTVR